MIWITLLATLSAMTAACGSGAPVASGPTAASQPAAAAARRASGDPELLRTLAILATRKLPSDSQLTELRARFEAGQLAMPAYIDSLVASPEFATDVAPIIVFRGLLSATSRQIAGD